MHTPYSCHIRYLSAVCMRYLADSEDVKDVLQDAFVKIITSIGTFVYQGEGSLRGWMSKIVLNETLKFIRRKRRIDFAEFDGEKIDIVDDTTADASTSGIPPEAIHRMTRELPDGYRAIFNLYVVEDKSHKEIAALRGIKESTSASQLHLSWQRKSGSTTPKIPYHYE